MQSTTDMKRQQRSIMLVLSVSVAAFVAAGFVAFAMWSNEVVFGGMAMMLFDLDTEQNLPTWFSTVLLAYLALAAWKLVPTKGHTLTKLAHVALGLGFLFLSADEAALLHERVGGTVELDNALHNARWIILWLPVLGLCGLVMLAVLWRSSPRLTVGLAAGAVVYLTGAIGVETLNQYNRHNEVLRLQEAGVEPHETRKFNRADQRYGNDTLVYVAGTAIEEGLEMSGMLVWAAVIFAAQRRKVGEGSLSLTDDRPVGASRTRELKPEPAQRVASAR